MQIAAIAATFFCESTRRHLHGANIILPRTTARVVTPYCHRATSKGSSGGLAQTFLRQLYWASPQRPRGGKKSAEGHRLAVPMILALLPNQSQLFAHLSRRIAEKPCCLTIVAHNCVQKSRPRHVDIGICAELEYTRLLLGHIGIT